MSGANRIAGKGRLTPAKTARFTFDGKSYTALEGDTVASALIAFGWLVVFQLLPARTAALLATGLVLVAAIGWLDDHRPLSPWPRLAVHAGAAALVGIACVLSGRGGGSALFAFATVMVLVNVWNFMDGIDGLAASQALLVATSWALLGWPEGSAWMLLAVAAACLGFLPFNLPSARIFLGDVGSGSIGYLLAVGLLRLPPAASRWPWLAWLPLSAFLVDAGRTLAMRMIQRERWWTPHLHHAYQRWAARSRSHGAVTMGYALWTAAAGATMVLARGAGRGGGATTLAAGYAMAVVAWSWLRRDRRPQEGGRQS